MSTDYPLKETDTKEVYLLEASSRVSLNYIDKREDTPHLIMSGMDARELARVGLEFLKVASYLDGDLIEALKGQDKYVLDEIRNAMKGT